jgi:hypothetical protein
MNGYACYLDSGCYVKAESEEEAFKEAVRVLAEWLQAAAHGKEVVEMTIELDEEGILQE